MSIARWMMVCSLLMAFSNAARAGDPLAKPTDAIAGDHLKEGNKLYRIREFEKANAAYKAGALREDASVFLYNLGQCYRQLGKYEDATWHYERFLSRARPTGELKNAVDGFVRDMRSELEKRAMTKPPIEPAPGTATPAPASSVPPVSLATSTDNRWYSDGLAWGLVGVGVVGGVASGYLFLSASDIDGEADREPRQEVRNGLQDKASKRRLVGTIVGVGAFGLLATGIVKLAIHPKLKRDRITQSWNVGFSADSVVVMGRF